MKRKREKRKSVRKPDMPNGIFIENTKMHLIIIFFFSVVLYSNTLFNDYAQDDAIVITDNMFTKKGLSGIPGILGNDSFYGFFKKRGKAKLVSGGRYRPLSLVSFAIETQFFGLNPAVSHFINIVLYGLLGIVMYKLLSLMFLNVKNKKLKFFLIFVTTIAYIAHPIHTEVVANIKGRDELFAMLFSFMAVIYSIKWFRTKESKYRNYTFFIFLLALFSKENAITFIAVVPLIYYLFIKGRKKSYFGILYPFLLASILFLLVRTYILGLDFGNNQMELMNNPFLKFSGGTLVHFTPAEKLATVIFTLGRYILLLLFPHPLTNDYYPRQISIMNFGDWEVILSMLFYIGIIFVAFKSYKKSKVLTFSIFYYLVTLSIVSNIIFPVGTNMSERFLFLPSFGFSLLTGLLMYYIYIWRKSLSFVLMAILLLAYSTKTFSRNKVWKDDFTLFTTDVKVSSNSAKALNAAGGSLVDAAFKEKNSVKKAKMLNQAIAYLDRALKIYPKYKNAYLIMGNAYYFKKDYKKAIAAFEKALKLAPNYKDAKRNLAITYRDAGKYYGEKKQDMQQALLYLAKALKLDDTDYEILRLNGVANAMVGNKLKAIEFFEKALKINPNNAGANLNLGNAYYNNGDSEKGKKYHDIARKIDPEVFDNN